MTEPVDNDIVAGLKRMRYDLTAMQGKLTDLLEMAARLNIATSENHPCRCGLTFKSARKLAEHVYTSHDGPEPEHWRDAEEAAA